MFRPRRILIIILSILAGLVLLCMGLWLFYRNARWGFAREVPEGEASRRMLLIQTAESWLGANEADGSHQEIIDLYNSQESLPMDYEVLYTDSWCAAFVTAAAMEADLTDIIPPECGCERQIGRFQELGCWQETDTYLPLPGDIIYYAWDEKPFGECTGWADHVGIVTGTCWPFVKVIEGNKEDRVDYRIVSIWNGTIRGYGLPQYDASETGNPVCD